MLWGRGARRDPRLTSDAAEPSQGAGPRDSPEPPRTSRARRVFPLTPQPPLEESSRPVPGGEAEARESAGGGSAGPPGGVRPGPEHGTASCSRAVARGTEEDTQARLLRASRAIRMQRVIKSPPAPCPTSAQVEGGAPVRRRVPAPLTQTDFEGLESHFYPPRERILRSYWAVELARGFQKDFHLTGTEEEFTVRSRLK